MKKSKPKTVGFKPGDRVVTNDAYAALFAGKPMRNSGVILNTVPHIPGAWCVRFDRNERRPQHVHEKFLQRESEQ